ncbi:hypothetical protein AB0K80_03020 [Streptomyces sp. NPDC052682]|uniref:hypothetical protein n=1 Tax=Streptomyces sp. NPDC052682 TaxID=3154954 RepID=UPI00343F7A49
MTAPRVTYTIDYKVNPPAVVRDGAPGPEGVTVRLSRTADGPARDRLDSVRGFHLLAEDGTYLGRLLTTQPLGYRLSGRPAVYDVLDARDVPLGRITLRRRRAFRWGRTRWTVEPATGPVLHGFQGRLVWWALWWPLGAPIRLVWLVMALLGDGDDGFGPPRRIIWRDASRRTHLVFRGLAGTYEVRAPGLDPRLVSALVGLHQSLDPNEEARTAYGWY